MRTPVIPLALLCVISTPSAAQRSHRIETAFGRGAIQIAFDQPVARRADRVDALLRARRGWPLGGEPGALLVTTARYEIAHRVLEPGRYAMRLSRDTLATWLVLVPNANGDVSQRDVPSLRFSLMEGPLDPAVDSLDIHLDVGDETAATIVFGYDTAHRKTIDRYSISTERNPPNRRLVIDWGPRQWTLSLTAAEP